MRKKQAKHKKVSRRNTPSKRRRKKTPKRKRVASRKTRTPRRSGKKRKKPKFRRSKTLSAIKKPRYKRRNSRARRNSHDGKYYRFAPKKRVLSPWLEQPSFLKQPMIWSVRLKVRGKCKLIMKYRNGYPMLKRVEGHWLGLPKGPRMQKREVSPCNPPSPPEYELTPPAVTKNLLQGSATPALIIRTWDDPEPSESAPPPLDSGTPPNANALETSSADRVSDASTDTDTEAVSTAIAMSILSSTSSAMPPPAPLPNNHSSPKNERPVPKHESPKHEPRIPKREGSVLSGFSPKQERRSQCEQGGMESSSAAPRTRLERYDCVFQRRGRTEFKFESPRRVKREPRGVKREGGVIKHERLTMPRELRVVLTDGDEEPSPAPRSRKRKRRSIGSYEGASGVDMPSRPRKRQRLDGTSPAQPIVKREIRVKRERRPDIPTVILDETTSSEDDDILLSPASSNLTRRFPSPVGSEKSEDSWQAELVRNKRLAQERFRNVTEDHRRQERYRQERLRKYREEEYKDPLCCICFDKLRDGKCYTMKCCEESIHLECISKCFRRGRRRCCPRCQANVPTMTQIAIKDQYKQLKQLAMHHSRSLSGRFKSR